MAKERALVYGLAVAGQATARALIQRGYKVLAADDYPTDEGLSFASDMGIDLFESPPLERMDRLAERVDLVVPSPGIPERHPIIASARRVGVPLRTELDLAFEWEQNRADGPRPMLAVTGTDGKTTTTLMAVAMIEASGQSAVAAGNTDVPLVSALDLDVDVFVVECASFRLAYLTCFRPEAAAWLNLAPDHLDWHTTLDSYAAAKARMWEFQNADDTAIGFVNDSTVMAHLKNAPARHLTFGSTGANYFVDEGWLVGPGGRLAQIASMSRSLPHDITNALAASALTLEAGVSTPEAIADALANFAGVAHRISLVGDYDGVQWYDDSKATTPHAALTAIRGFSSVVLIAGGRNKNLDLAAMAGEPSRMRGVVAIGDAADEIAAAFDGVCTVVTALSMDEAVEAAGRLAHNDDVVLLSPGCTSYDWYGGYSERGDDFVACVHERFGKGR